MAVYEPLDPPDELQRQKYDLDIIDYRTPLECSATDPELPFFHTTRGKHLRRIFAELKISPTTCPVFLEELLYLFYGKPAFRVASVNGSTSDPGPFPVTFIIRNISGHPLKRIFPFDTGALVGGFYKGICDDCINPRKYELNSTPEQIQKFISYFYGTAKDYFYRKCKLSNSNLTGFREEIRHVYALITQRLRTASDNRGYTIETQSDTAIPFDGSHIEAIIMPSDYAGDREFDDYVFNQGIDVLPYSLDQDNPDHMTKLIIKMAEDYMVDLTRGYL